MGQPGAEPKTIPPEAPDTDEALPFRVELWATTGNRPERVIGKAASLVLARAIFQAAQTDFFGKRITLSRADQILMDSQ
jgi:hypothetical protein